MSISRVLFAWQPRREGESEFDELIRPVREFLRRFQGGGGGDDGGSGGGGRTGGRPPFKLIISVLILGILVWLGTGIFIVNPGEVAIVRTFGAWNGGALGPGLNWHVPWPVQKVDILSIQQVRSMELGFRSIGEIGAGGGFTLVPIEARMITGDENLVDVQLVIQYRIRDAGAFLFNVKDPTGLPDGDTLRDVTASALRQVVGQRGIDDVLTTGKEIVQVDTQVLLQRILDDYGTGISIVNVQLQDVQPPPEVQAAFKDVISAREDRERFINEAEAYKEDVIPRARGEAQRVLQDAEAFKFERVAAATGEANRFISRLIEYRLAQEATRIRLYLETLERVLPGVKVIVIDRTIGDNLLPFLPLQSLNPDEGA